MRSNLTFEPSFVLVINPDSFPAESSINKLKGTHPSVSDPPKVWVVLKFKPDCSGTLSLPAKETVKVRLGSEIEKLKVSVSPVFAKESP